MRSFCAGWTRAKTEMPLDALRRARRRTSARARARRRARRPSRAMPERLRDREARRLVVAGHHHRPDARPRGSARPRPRTSGARRIDLADEPEQRRAAAKRGEAGAAVDLGAVDDGDREHAQRALGHALRRGAHRAPRRRRRARRSSPFRRAARQSSSTTSGAPLTTTREPPASSCCVAIIFAAGIERDLGAPRPARPQLGRDDAALDREREERDLGRIADRLPARLGLVRAPASCASLHSTPASSSARSPSVARRIDLAPVLRGTRPSGS